MKLLALFVAALFLISCKGEPDKKPIPEAAPPTLPSGQIVMIETSMGTIKARLHDETAPLTVKNFLSYVDGEFYDNTIFHRVISNFMIQGGGFAIPDSTPKEKKNNPPVRNESQQTLKNSRGTLAMARTSDPHSATSQFFINVQDNPSLDYPNNGGGYAVFGEVLEGMEVVDKIKEVETHSAPMLNLVGDLYQVGSAGDVPVEPVFIKSIRRAPASQ